MVLNLKLVFSLLVGGGVESKISVQLISPKLNNFDIVIIMPEIGYPFNFNHCKPFIFKCNCTIPSTLCKGTVSKCPQKAGLSRISDSYCEKCSHRVIEIYHSSKACY